MIKTWDDKNNSSSAELLQTFPSTMEQKFAIQGFSKGVKTATHDNFVHELHSSLSGDMLQELALSGHKVQASARGMTVPDT